MSAKPSILAFGVPREAILSAMRSSPGEPVLQVRTFSAPVVPAHIRTALERFNASVRGAR